MESMETKLLNKYNIATLFPAQWPEDKDYDSDEDDAPAPTSTAQPPRFSKSRYSVLESGGRYQRKLPGVEKTRDGADNLVQKDEHDPLGSFPSVVQVLRQRGLPVEEDIKLRNRFLLSSTTFSPSLFLSQVHSSASTDSLLAGLEFLSHSIEKKSASLKVLVESNFERFVSAKATIDRVYNEMRDVGKEPESPSERLHTHARGPSGSSFSSRKLSVSLAPGVQKPPPPEKKKNALVKESEYGVHGIKVPLTEVAVKAEEVWGPALGGREKEETLKTILASVEKNRGLFEVGSAIQDAIRRRDHDMVVEEYTRARKFAEDARYVVEQANYTRAQLSDGQIHQIIVTARMWADVEHQIEAFKRDAWRRLASTHFAKHQTDSEEAKSEQYMSLISIMLELGVEDNPIWVWLLSRYDYLKNRLAVTCERSKVEIEILRRHLSNSEKPGLRLLSKHLRSVPTSSNIGLEPSKLDTPKVVEFWDHVHASMTTLLSTNGGLLGEIVEYWDIAQSFVNGRAQRSLPMGFNNQSSVHHQLSSDNITDLEQGLTELVHIIREHIYSFFADPPIEDISLLFSPVPNTPTPTTPRTPLSAALSPTVSSRFRFDPNNMPPPSPMRGETWEKYAFWPPNSNALSGAHYLTKTLVLIGTAANELASLRLPEIGANSRIDEHLRVLVGGVRERSVQAICAAWNTDATNLKVLEDWTRDPERKDITTMPSRFLAVQSFLLTNLQKIMYVEASSKTAVDVLVPPSSKLLQMVRSQFVSSFYRTLSGMVECAEKGRRALGREFEVKGDDLTVGEDEGEDGGWGKVDANSQSIRLLLTLSNMSSLQTEITPQLLTLFENLFSVQLTSETNQIRDVLSQLDANLFDSYTKRHTATIASTIHAGIFSPSWAPPAPRGKSVADRDPSPYVFAVLLSLVVTHTEVTTTSPPLTSRILRALFEATVQSLITTFSALPACSLAALMQATLDVEFMAQTLQSYTTEKASAVQTHIYQVLDQKTDNKARVRLQEELGALRGVLKRLREGTRVEFVCFRRGKRGTVGVADGGAGVGAGVERRGRED
ncbi:exocyst complex component Sec5-domain-containing protein [Massariosphaeria phaeospora]|uniref:Exocyst complex component SEC5 n=1 Tax=Massariosphaeria phaeospora TaxID=100035 RepID=A0A7C8M8V2_9PLEO|nr:exocyst complex component Sec5-domain-containing protein [Massariosphaeria phaeospora]